MPPVPSVPGTLLVVVAHPDDESFGCGAMIATAAAEGQRVVVCCASRGELGEDATGRHRTPETLGATREAELRAAADILGAHSVELLGLADSGWSGEAATGSIVAEPEVLQAGVRQAIARNRPDIVVTMDPTGSDGHRDHAAVGRAATAAFAATVDWPASLYHWCLPHSLMDAWCAEIAAQDPNSVYAGTELGRADADITTILDGRPVSAQVRRAIAAHRTQVSPFANVSTHLADQFIGQDHLVRQVPSWTGGEVEHHLSRPPR